MHPEKKRKTGNCVKKAKRRVSDRADKLVGCGSIKELRLLHLTLSVPVSGGPMVDVHIIKKAMDAVKELIQFRELLHELKIDAPND